MAKRLLLDTCSALWFGMGSPELSISAKEAIVDGRNEVFVSSVSAWEIGVKWSLGKLPLPENPSTLVPKLIDSLRFRELTVEVADALIAESLPWHHKDPFDRLLICQAMRKGLTIVTPDDAIRRYDVPTLW